VTTLMQAPTVESFARRIREQRAVTEPSSGEARLGAPTPPLSFVVPLQESPGKAALFCVHGAGGDVISLRNVGLGIGNDFSFYGIQSRGVDGTSPPFESIEEMASAYLKEVRIVQPNGPYYLSGFCGGGLVAFEMANQLRAQGESVRLLALLGSRRPGSVLPGSRIANWHVGIARRGFAFVLARAAAFAKRELAFLSARLRIFSSRVFGRSIPHEIRNMWLTWAFFRAERRYRPPVYPGPLTLLRPSEDPVSERNGGLEFGWRGFAQGGVEIQEIPGSHETILQRPHAAVVAQKLKELTLKASGRNRR